MQWATRYGGYKLTILQNLPIFGTFVANQLRMSKNTSISLGNHFENFVQSRISAGRYNNTSEVIRAGLRLLEEEESKVIALKHAIQEGIESGMANNFNPEEHLKQLKAKRGLNG